MYVCLSNMLHTLITYDNQKQKMKRLAILNRSVTSTLIQDANKYTIQTKYTKIGLSIDMILELFL